MKFFIFLLLNSLFSMSVLGQVKVREYGSLKLIPNAKIHIDGAKGIVSNMAVLQSDTSFQLPSVRPLHIRVTASEYISQEDTLWNFKPVTFLLQKEKMLDAIVITGQVKPIAASQSMYPVKVFDKQMIRQKGAVNLADLLNTELNAKIMSDNVLGTVLLMQGLSGQNVKILMDGVPQVAGTNNEFDLSQLNLSGVERVEMIEGPLSVQYGTNALAGTINMISRNLPASKNWQGGVGAYTESIGQYNTTGWIGKNIGGWNTLINGSYTYFGGYTTKDYKASVINPSNTVRGMDWFPRKQINGSAKIYRQLGHIRTGLQYNQLHEERTSKGEADAGTSYLTANDYLYMVNRSNLNLYANGNISQHTYLDVTNSYNHFDNDNIHYWVNLQNNSRKTLDNDITRFNTWTFRGTLSRFDLGKKKLNYQFGYDVNLNKGTGQRIADTASRINDIGIFSGIGMTFFNQLEGRISFRYVNNSKYNAKDINLFNAKLPIIPAVQLRWNLPAGFQARLSYTRAFRAPSLLELYRQFINTIHYIVGNTELRPELADNYQFSLTWKKQHGQNIFTIQPFLFLNNLKNKIELVELDRATLPAEFQSITVARTYANIARFKTRGINLNLGYSYSDILQIKPGVSWLARSGTNSSGQLFNSYDANTSVQYHWHGPDISFAVFYKYSGKMSQFALSYGQLVDRTLNGYSLMDISLAHALIHKKLQLTTGVKNLFNTINVLQYGNGDVGLISRSGSNAYVPISWGRTIFLRASIDF